MQFEYSTQLRPAFQIDRLGSLQYASCGGDMNGVHAIGIEASIEFFNMSEMESPTAAPDCPYNNINDKFR